MIWLVTLLVFFCLVALIFTVGLLQEILDSLRSIRDDRRWK